MNLRANAMHVALALALGLFASGAAAAKACEAAGHRGFDFWLGEWQVRTPDGKLAGVNRIESEYDGCVLHERYTTGRGYSDESLNVYDAARKLWHQTWVDTAGTHRGLQGHRCAGTKAISMAWDQRLAGGRAACPS